jgi:hypothetical protein
MSEPSSISPTYPATKASSQAIIQLRQEYLENLDRLQAQPALVQRFLETQAAALADAILQGASQARFSLPDRVILIDAGQPSQTAAPVPNELREQAVGRLMERLRRADLRTALRQRLLELEQHPNPAVALSAFLLRFSIAMHMVHNLLPSGRTVRYVAAEGEEIPSLPVEDTREPASAITAQTDAIVESEGPENGRGELQVPYVPAARQFYLPQWVAFDLDGRLLVNSSSEAEAHIASMQRYLSILHTAVGLVSCMVADDDYQPRAEPQPAVLQRSKPGPRDLRLRDHPRRAHHVCQVVCGARRP